MIDDATARLALPLLQPGQAQKEMFHNEALARLDLAVQPVVADVGRNAPPDTPTLGGCWIVGSAPSDAWAGHAGALAGWTSGGWRFIAPHEGMQAWSLADDQPIRYDGGAWRIGALRGGALVIGGAQVVAAQQPPIASPADGAVIDTQARATLDLILNAMRAHGLVAS
ncbi:MAG: hypothetical protein C0476_06965 [Sphingomonas sp.]|nr:hypothetical protein [Sphingomonas sp.]